MSCMAKAPRAAAMRKSDFAQTPGRLIVCALHLSRDKLLSISHHIPHAQVTLPISLPALPGLAVPTVMPGHASPPGCLSSSNVESFLCGCYWRLGLGCMTVDGQGTDYC